MVPVYSFYGYLNGKLAITWREWMTRWLMGANLARRAYYRIAQSKTIDNPDQRISEDVNTFVTSSISLSLLVISSLITAASFAFILWSISPKLALILVAYAAGATALSFAVGSRLVDINFSQQRLEADFRFGLLHLRDNAESIALSSGENYEFRELGRRLANVVRNFDQLISWQRNLSFLTTGYGNSVRLLPYIALASTYFSGRIQLGQLTQAIGAFATLQGSLSLIVNQFQTLSSFAAVVRRLSSFRRECDAPLEMGSGTSAIETIELQTILLDRLTLTTPGAERVLVRELTAEIAQGGRMLIVGESGRGKSSVIRAIAGLWTRGDGIIARPALSEIMFLPQRPYLALGSLRDQICYPGPGEAADEELLRVLQAVNLGNLPERVGGLDVEKDWAHFLSSGEQQRLAFGRLLLRLPRYAFLDEATSALDSVNEMLLYSQLAKTSILYASISHRPGIDQYHDQVLKLRGDGEWEIARVEQSRTASVASEVISTHPQLSSQMIEVVAFSPGT